MVIPTIKGISAFSGILVFMIDVFIAVENEVTSSY